MTRRIGFILSFCFFFAFAHAQNPSLENKDTVKLADISTRFKGGFEAFLDFFGRNFKYPVEALNECREGKLLLRVNVRPSGVLDSIEFLNEIPLGLGIEKEVVRTLMSAKGQWLRSTKTSKLSLSIRVTRDKNPKDKSGYIVTSYATHTPNDCPTDQDLIKSLNQEKKKKNYKEAVVLCEDILRRQPESEEYKRELAELQAKLK